MSGTKVFKLDCFLDPANLTQIQLNQAAFKIIWDFFKQMETEGHCTEIARNNGAPATFSPTPLGTGFYDEASAFGQNAWAVFQFPASPSRTLPYCVLMQWASGTAFGTAPGSPGLIYNSAGSSGNIQVGFSMAAGLTSADAPASSPHATDGPWPFAATGSLGSDTKQTPVWNAKGTAGNPTNYFFPISNETGGTHATNKQNTIGLSTSSATSSLRIDCIGDADNWFIAFNVNNAFNDLACVGGGLYFPHSSNISPEIPLFMLNTRTTASFVDRTNVWGVSAGTGTREGAIGRNTTNATPTANVAVDFSWDSQMERRRANLETDTATSPSKFPLYPLQVCASTSHVGHADQDFWRVTYGLYPRDSTSTKSHILFSGTTQASDPNVASLMMPWDGSTIRCSNFTRNGIIS